MAGPIQAGLNEPQTMREQQARASLMRDQGYSPEEIAQATGNSSAPPPQAGLEPAAPAETSIAEDLGEMLTYGTQTLGESVLRSVGDVAGDRLGFEGAREVLTDWGESVGPSEEFEAEYAAAAEDDSILRAAGKVAMQEIPAMLGTIGASAAVGSAVPVFGTLAGAATGVGISYLRVRDEIRARALAEKRKRTGDENAKLDDDDLMMVDVTALGSGVMEAFTPVKYVRKVLGAKVVDDLIKKGITKAAMKEGVKAFGQEGATEIGQMALQEIVYNPELQEKMTAKDRSDLMPYIAREFGREAAIAFLGGGAVGGGVGAPTGAYVQSVNNARREDDITLLEEAGADNAMLVEAAQDRDAVGQMSADARELRNARARAEDAEAMAAQVPEPVPELDERAAALRAKADEVADRVLPAYGGKTRDQIAQEEADLAEIQKSVAMTDMADLGLDVPADTPAAPAALAQKRDELSAVVAAREEAESAVERATTPKKRIKREKEARSARTTENALRRDLEVEVGGATREDAEARFVQREKGEDTSELDAAVAEYSKIPTDAGRLAKADETVAAYDTTELQQEVATLQQQVMEAEDPETLTATVDKLKVASDKLANPPAAVLAARQVQAELKPSGVGPDAGGQVAPATPGDGATSIGPEGEAGGVAPEAESVEAPEPTANVAPAGPAPEADAASTPPEGAGGEGALPGGAIPAEGGALPGGAIPTEGGVVTGAAPAEGGVVTGAAPAEGGVVTGAAPAEGKLTGVAEDYFEPAPDQTTIPISQLVPTRRRPEGVAGAAMKMEQAARGEIPKRAPISVRENDDGTYTMLDGDSTYAVAEASGWTDMPVRILTDQQFAEESAGRLADRTGTELVNVTPDGVIRVKGPESTRAAVEQAAARAGVVAELTTPADNDIPVNDPRRTGAPNIVVKDTGAEYAYRDMIDDLGDTTTVDEAEAWMSEQGDGSEYAVLLDDDGNVLQAGTNDNPDGVSTNTEMMDASAPDSLTFTHNHPIPTGFSSSDIGIGLTEPSLKEIRAVLPNRQAISMSRPAGKAPRSWAQMQPIITAMRGRVWQEFESLVGWKAAEAARMNDPYFWARVESEAVSRALVSEGEADYDNSGLELTDAEDQYAAALTDAAAAVLRDGLEYNAGSAAAPNEEQPRSGVAAGGRGGARPQAAAARDVGAGPPSGEGLRAAVAQSQSDPIATADKYGVDQDLRERSTLNLTYGGGGPAESLGGTRQVAEYLQDLTPEAERLSDPKYAFTPEDFERFAKLFAAETDMATQQTDNAADWYSKAVEKAVELMSVKYPALTDPAAAEAAGFGTPENAKFMLAYSMAVTSQNLGVQANMDAADKAFQAIQDAFSSGDYTVPDGLGTGDKQRAMNENFNKFNQLFATKPMRELSSTGRISAIRKMFNEKATIKEWEARLKAMGYKGFKVGSTNNDTEVFGSAILGPKIGNGFYQNLIGNHDPITIDLWLRRTFGRMIGSSIGIPSAFEGQRDRLKRSALRSAQQGSGDPEAIAEAQKDLAAKRQAVTQLEDSEPKGRQPKGSPPKSVWRNALSQAKADRDAAIDVLNDVRNTRIPEVWSPDYDTDRDAYLAYANRLSNAWTRHFNQLGDELNPGRKKQQAENNKIRKAGGVVTEKLPPLVKVPDGLKPTWAFAANSIVGAQTKPLDQVANGTQRKNIEGSMRRALELLTEQGINVTPADMQALIWYPEKDLWASLGAEQEVDPETGQPIVVDNPLSESYDTVIPEMLRSQGYDVEGQSRTARRAAGAEAGGGVAGAGDGRPEGGGRAGEVRNQPADGGREERVSAAEAVDAALGREIHGKSWLGRRGYTELTPEQTRAMIESAARLTGVEPGDTAVDTGGWFDPDDGVVKVEPSSLTEVAATGDKLRQFAAVLGDMAGQWSVLTMDETGSPTEGGNSTVVQLTAPPGSEMTNQELFEFARSADPVFGGFTPFDKGGRRGIKMVLMDDWTPQSEQTAGIERLATLTGGAGNGTEVYARRGASEFIEGEEDGAGYLAPSGQTSRLGQDDGILSRARREAAKILGDESLATPIFPDAPSPIYISRDVDPASAQALTDWATEAGFTDLIPPDEMHLTVIWSPTDVDPAKAQLKDDTRSVKTIGKPRELGDSLVVPVMGGKLAAENQRYKDAGGTSTFDSYIPHVSFKTDPTDADRARLKGLNNPKLGIDLGPEIAKPIRPNTANALDDVINIEMTTPDQTADLRDALRGRRQPRRDRIPQTEASRAATRRLNMTVADIGRSYDILNDAETAPDDALSQIRHSHTSYDRDNVLDTMNNQAYASNDYKARVTETSGALQEIIDAQVDDPARKKALSAELLSWTRSRRALPVGKIDSKASALMLAKNAYRANRRGDLSRKELRNTAMGREMGDEGISRMLTRGRDAEIDRPSVAAALDVPDYLDIGGKKGASYTAMQAMNFVAQNPRGAADGAWGITGKLLSRVEDQLINRFAPIRRLETSMRKAAGADTELGIGMDSAFKAAEMAVNDSGRNEALLYYGAAKVGEHGQFTTAPGTKGLRKIFDSIGKGQNMVDWMSYMAARRAQSLMRKGIKTPLLQQQINDALAKETPAFMQAAADWKAHNDANIQFLIDTGTITEAQAEGMRADDFYVPFYRSEERADGTSPELRIPEMLGGGPRGKRRSQRGSLTDVDPGIKAMIGGDKLKIDNLMKNMIKNSQAMVAAGMRNKAANQAVDMMQDAGLVRTTKHWQKTPGAITIRTNGKKRSILPAKGVAPDEIVPLVQAIAGLQPIQRNAIQQFMTQIGSAFRQSITLSPGFMARNGIRGAVSAGVLTAGSNLSLANNTATGFIGALRNSDATKAFKRESGMGDFRMGGTDIGFGKDDILIDYGLAPKTVGYKIRKAVNSAEAFGTATELADRVAAYESMVAAGIRSDEAAYQALNIINYGRHGANPTLRVMLPMIPFLNARIQGLARLGEGAVGTRGATGRKQAMMTLALYGGIVTAASAALWAWNNADDERREKYLAEPLYRRLNYHIMYTPAGTLYLPKAFELGHLFSSIPELIADGVMNDVPGEFKSGMAQIIGQTVGFNAIPAGATPMIEALANYSFFTGQPIVGQREGKGRRAEDRTGNASELAKLIGRNMGFSNTTGISPTMIEHLLQGYGGVAWSLMSGATDIAGNELGISGAKPEGAFGDVPIVSPALERALGSMLKDPNLQTDKYVGEFYEMADHVGKIYLSAKDAATNGDIDHARDILARAPATPQVRKLLTKTASNMGKINAAIRALRNDRSLTPAEKSAKLTPLYRTRNALAAKVVKMVREVEDDQGATFASAA